MSTIPSVFITGTTSGIGLATAKQLDARGWRVFAGVLPQEDTARLRDGASERLHIVPIDITQPQLVYAARDTVSRALGDGGLKGLVNNAGIAVPGPLEILPLDDIRRQMEVNFTAQVAVTQAFLPLIRRGGGRIVNIGSILGRVVTPYSGAYCASKFAIEAFTEALRMELRPWGIPVSVVEPTIIATNIWKETDKHLDTIHSELSGPARELYAAFIIRMQQATQAQSRLAAPTDKVVAAIVHALSARRPKTRYPVGPDARAMVFISRFLPDRWREQIILRRLGMWR